MAARDATHRRTPLHWAALADAADVAARLLDHGADFAAVDVSGATAMDLAVEHDCTLVVQVGACCRLGRLASQPRHNRRRRAAHAPHRTWGGAGPEARPPRSHRPAVSCMNPCPPCCAPRACAGIHQPGPWLSAWCTALRPAPAWKSAKHRRPPLLLAFAAVLCYFLLERAVFGTADQLCPAAGFMPTAAQCCSACASQEIHLQ